MGKITAECSLAELVEDPLVGLVMESDGVDRRTLELLLQRVARDRAQGVGGLRLQIADEEVTRCSPC
jgi:hypothetical protein